MYVLRTFPFFDFRVAELDVFREREIITALSVLPRLDGLDENRLECGYELLRLVGVMIKGGQAASQALYNICGFRVPVASSLLPFAALTACRCAA